MPNPCDTCRHCPSSYPSKGVTGEAVERSPDFGWEGTCLRGHRVGILWEWATEHFVNEASLMFNIWERESTLHVTNSTRFPAQPGFKVQVDQEAILVTGVDIGSGGNTWRVTRGVDGTPSAPHIAGAVVTGAKLAVIRLYRSNTLGDCSDWAKPIRISRYERKWVI